MNAFNEWLNVIQHNGGGSQIYDTIGFVCMILVTLSGLLYIWHQRIHWLKGICIGVIVYNFLGYAQHLMTWYRRDFAWDNYMGTANIGYAFTLLPLLCWLCDKTFNTTDGTSGELAAVSTLSWHFLGRFACTFSGCCHGIACSWGIYSHTAELYKLPGGLAFPVCALESLLTLGILIFLLVRIHRRGRVRDNGKALPYMLLLYGGGRFFTEFLRFHPEEDILFGFLPEYSVHALLMAAVGGLCLYLAHRRPRGGEPIPERKKKAKTA